MQSGTKLPLPRCGGYGQLKFPNHNANLPEKVIALPCELGDLSLIFVIRFPLTIGLSCSQPFQDVLQHGRGGKE